MFFACAVSMSSLYAKLRAICGALLATVIFTYLLLNNGGFALERSDGSLREPKNDTVNASNETATMPKASSSNLTGCSFGKIAAGHFHGANLSSSYAPAPTGPFRIQLKNGTDCYYISKNKIFVFNTTYQAFYVAGDAIRAEFSTDESVAALYKKSLAEGTVSSEFAVSKKIRDEEYTYTANGLFLKHDNGEGFIYFEMESSNEVSDAFFPWKPTNSFRITLKDKDYYYINSEIYVVDSVTGVFFPADGEIKMALSEDNAVAAFYCQGKAEGNVSDDIFLKKNVGDLEYLYSNVMHMREEYYFRNVSRRELEWKTCDKKLALQLQILFFPDEETEPFELKAHGVRYVYVYETAYYYHESYDALAPIENSVIKSWFHSKRAVAVAKQLGLMQNRVKYKFKIQKKIHSKTYVFLISPQVGFFITQDNEETAKIADEDIDFVKPFFFLIKPTHYFAFQSNDVPRQEHIYINNKFYFYDPELKMFFPAVDKKVRQWSASSNVDFAASYAQNIYEGKIITKKFLVQRTIGNVTLIWSDEGMRMQSTKSTAEGNAGYPVASTTLLYKTFFPENPANPFFIILNNTNPYLFLDNNLYNVFPDNFSGFHAVEDETTLSLFHPRNQLAATYTDAKALGKIYAAERQSFQLKLGETTYVYRFDGQIEAHYETFGLIDLLNKVTRRQQINDKADKEKLLTAFFPKKPSSSFKIAYANRKEYYYMIDNKSLYYLDQRHRSLFREPSDEILSKFSWGFDLAVTYSQEKACNTVLDKFSIEKKIGHRMYAFASLGEGGGAKYYVKIGLEGNQWAKHDETIMPDLRPVFFPTMKPGSRFRISLGHDISRQYYYLEGKLYILVNENMFLPVLNENVLALFTNDLVCATYSDGVLNRTVDTIFNITKAINNEKYEYNQDGFFKVNNDDKLIKADDETAIYNFFFPCVPNSFTIEFPSSPSLSSVYYFELQQCKAYMVEENGLLKLASADFITRHCATYEVCASTYLKALQDKKKVAIDYVISKEINSNFYTYSNRKIRVKLNETEKDDHIEVFNLFNYHIFFEEASAPLEYGPYDDEINYFFILLGDENVHGSNANIDKRSNEQQNNNVIKYYYENGSTYIYHNGSFYIVHDTNLLKHFAPLRFKKTYKIAKQEGRLIKSINAVKFDYKNKPFFYYHGEVIRGEPPFAIVKDKSFILEAHRYLFHEN